MRQIVDATGWKQQSVRRDIQPRGVGDRRHLDGGFGAVEKRVEHLRVHAGGLGLAGREPVVAPDAVRRHLVIGGQVLGPFAGGDNAKPGGPRPVHHLGSQCGLVAIGQRIDDAGFAGFLRQQRSRQHVGLDIDHDDMLAGGNRRARVADAGRGVAGGFHDHLDRIGRRASPIIGECRCSDPGGVPANGAACVAGALHIAIDDDRDLEARRMRHLRQEHRTEFAGADQRDADRLAGGAARIEQMMKVHGGDPSDFASRHCGHASLREREAAKADPGRALAGGPDRR